MPLPHEQPPTEPIIPRILRTLLAEKMIDQPTYDCCLLLSSEGKPAAAAHATFTAWIAAERDGKRVSNGLSVMSPGVPGLQPTTFRVDNFAVIMGGEQTEATAYLVHGFCHGFALHRAEDWTHVIYPNGPLPSEEAAQQFRAQLEKEGPRGFGYRVPIPFTGTDAREHGKLTSNPMFLREKAPQGVPTGKFRTIDHLSKHKPGHRSVNEGIPDVLGPVRLTNVNEFTELIDEVEEEWQRELEAASGPLTREPGRATVAHIGKLDVERGYYIMPIRREDWNSLVFSDLEGQLWWNTRLPMGLKPAARMFSSLNLTISWVLNHCGVRNKTYIDDMGVASKGRAANELEVDTACLLYELLKTPVSPPKLEKGKTLLVFLGLQVDTVGKTVGYPPEKLTRLKALLHEWLAISTTDIKGLERLIGILGDACQLIPQGRLFMRRLYGMLRYATNRARELGPRGAYLQIHLSAETRKDILWWVRNIELFDRGNGGLRPFYRTTGPAHRPQVISFTDASNLAFAGVSYFRFWALGYEGPTAYLRDETIAVREMAAVAVQCLNFGHEWRAKHCLFRCDNQGDVDSFRKWRNENPTALHLMRVIALAASRHCFTFEILWISSEENDVADLATRVSVDEFMRRCSHLQRLEHVLLPPRLNAPDWENLMHQEIVARNLGGILPTLRPVIPPRK